MNSRRVRSTRARGALCVLAVSLGLLCAAPSGAQVTPQDRERAKRLHDRLVGVPPAAGVLDDMAQLLSDGDGLQAAYMAMNDSNFYKTSLKNFVTPWTNVERTVFAPLNDYSALVIGMIRDDVPFDQVLSANLAYRGADGVVPTPYSPTSNQHYEELEENDIDLADPGLFIQVPQSSLTGSQLTAAETAGVTTTRAAGEAFFSAGTNRRMWRFTSLNYLCRDLEDTKDISRPVDRIRQDVTRSPGGDSSIFHNHCTGCHSGMDPLAGAYAYFEWDATQERVVFTRNLVQPKNLINDTVFPFGYITVDDRWDNYWREGPNQILDWRGPAAGGFGPRSLGVEVAASAAFSECQVEKVFEHVCFRPPNSQEDLDEIARVAGVFETESYSMKRVFAEVGLHCMDLPAVAP